MNSKQRILGSLLLLITSINSEAVGGEITSYTYEQREALMALSKGTSVIVGKVITAVREEPRLDDFCANSTWTCGGASPSSCRDGPHNIKLQVKVMEILGSPKHDEISPPEYANSHAVLEKIRLSELINLNTSLYNMVCLTDPEGYYLQERSALGALSLTPPVQGPTPMESVTPEIVRNLYVGRQFVFSVYAVRMVMDDPDPDSLIQSDPPRTYSAGIWPLERRGWAVHELRLTRGQDYSGPFIPE
jgi:hypothetical protein